MAGVEKARVLVWDENPSHAPKELYPNGLNGAIAEGLHALDSKNILAGTANIEDPEQGVSEAALAQTDVLMWWGHARHQEVTGRHGAACVSSCPRPRDGTDSAPFRALL